MLLKQAEKKLSRFFNFYLFKRRITLEDSHSHKLGSFVDPKVLMEKIQSGNGVVENIFGT